MNIQALFGELRSIKAACDKNDRWGFLYELSKRKDRQALSEEFLKHFRNPRNQELLTSHFSPFEIGVLLHNFRTSSLVGYYYGQFYEASGWYHTTPVRIIIPRNWYWLDFMPKVSNNFNGKEIKLERESPSFQQYLEAISEPQPLVEVFKDEVIAHKGYTYCRDNSCQLWRIVGLASQHTNENVLSLGYDMTHTFYTDTQMKYLLDREAPSNMKARKLLAPYVGK